ncbi:ABC transporter permease [Paenibacillus roseipurpureus]|uniref:ABC transporter permease subunit n=1 Tax=Paenibacillus roseopurpureus TaxID=2918901 RepID=A0AA96LS49_9BACL|nr:ABC transporter permease subunit [Paenibacillus sp. MBLB1832]WNR45551.1 ABC transporter permease subunit [Paenibacillus sp. MBLB1832]
MRVSGLEAIQSVTAGKKVRSSRSRLLLQNIPLLVMFIPGVLYYVVFKYIPIGGVVIAFKDYNFNDGIINSPWVGLKHFRILFSNPQSSHIIVNTLWLSVLRIVFGFPFPIILAIMLNEVRKSWFKRTVQTMVFIPHFFSWVIVGGIVLTIFGQESGTLNILLKQWTGQAYPFLYQASSWVAVYIGSGTWKEAGFASIIYLAALAAIDPGLYEAAAIDGASKARQIWHITLPGISTVIAMMFILSLGGVMDVSFDQAYILGNSVVADVSEVISTWIYKFGLQGGQFGITTAMGLFESLVALILITAGNAVARRFGKELW